LSKKKTSHNHEGLEKLDEIDQIIHSPTRLKILIVLAEVVKADFTFLVMTTGLTRGNLSANLRKLEETGYITIEKKFVNRVSKTMVQLTTHGRNALDSYQEDMQEIINILKSQMGS
jgi:DNA-binding transcriptional ArsR family regulator